MAKKKNKPKKGIEKTFTYPFGKEEIHWADMVSLKFAEEKFLLTFAQIHPYKGELTVISQIMLPPRVAESLANILSGAVVTYNKTYRKTTKK